MGNVKISELIENTNPSGSEELVYADNGANGRITLDTIKAYVTPAGAYIYRGTRATYNDLPSSGMINGDVYNIEAGFTLDNKKYPAGTNVAWNGSSRDPLGGNGFSANDFAYDLLTDESGVVVIENFNSLYAPSGDFTIDTRGGIIPGGGNLIPGMSYVLRIDCVEFAGNVTLGAGISNPFGETIALEVGQVTVIVFIAINDSDLEIQSARTTNRSNPPL